VINAGRLSLLAARPEPPEAAEILTGDGFFTASARNLQRIAAIPGGNPRLFRFAAANLQRICSKNPLQICCRGTTRSLNSCKTLRWFPAAKGLWKRTTN